MNHIPHAPEQFDGSLSELFERWAKNVLLSRPSVEEFHRELLSYLRSPDPLFLTRTVKAQERGAIIRNQLGHRLRATDNSPAWWIHAALFEGPSLQRDGFSPFIESIPCHMFEIRLRESINSAGWHVAHIFDAKDRNTAYQQWDQRELVRRMVRNLHPCNYFYLPKVNWQQYGGDPAVISFFTKKFAAMYFNVWGEFIDLAQAIPRMPAINVSEYRYTIPTESAANRAQRSNVTIGSEAIVVADGGSERLAARYSFSRLAFKADVIEPLGMDEMFRVDTPEGSYAMTKREFYGVFPLIKESRSYLHDRLYSYPKPPKRAQQFRLHVAVLANTR